MKYHVLVYKKQDIFFLFYNNLNEKTTKPVNLIIFLNSS